MSTLSRGFNEFAGNVRRLPVDQHLLMSLVAPRALLSLEGTPDDWTNPEGVQLTYQAARKVSEFLKARDRLSIRYRAVGHIPNIDELLECSDHLFYGRELSEE